MPYLPAIRQFSNKFSPGHHFGLMHFTGPLSMLLVLFLFPSLPSKAQRPQPEIFAPGIISGPVDEAAPVFSPDGNTVYFHRRSDVMGGLIMVSHKQKGTWSNPAIASFSGQWQDIEPAMAPDGSYLIFASNRPVASATQGGTTLEGIWSGKHYPGSGGNLWRVDRKGNGWGEPYRLPDIINHNNSIFSPAITADGTLYFMSPLADTGRFHLYRAAWRNGQYGQPEPLPFASADQYSDVDPAVAPDESFLIFSSNRPPCKKLQLFIVFNKNGNWSDPVNLGETVNLPGNGNTEAKLGPDHRILYYANNFVTPLNYPVNRAEREERLRKSGWETGAQNIWFVPLDSWLAETH